MSPPGENAARPNTVSPARRLGWRYFAQFSLRTLLLTTTIVAIGCWWFLRPELREEQLAGKFLQLRRQVRVERLHLDSASYRSPPRHPLEWTIINVGSWQLHDDQSNLLASGRYDRGQPDGWWTTYHPNGRKATQGRMQQGVKVGSWQAWDAAGQRISDLHYRPDPPTDVFQSIRHGPVRAWHPNGRLQLEGAYQNDRRVGTWTFSDDQGKVTETRQYSQ